MEIVVRSKDLRRAVERLGKVIERRVTNPVLGAVMAQASRAGGLRLWGTNLDFQLMLHVDAEIDGDREETFVLSLSAWRSIVDIAVHDLVTIRTDKPDADPDGMVEAECGGAKIRFRIGMATAEWPRFPDFDPIGGSTHIGHDDLARMIRLAEPCISTEETRYYLNGIFMTLSPDGIMRFVTADGHRMAVIDCHADMASIRDRSGLGFGAIISRYCLPILKSLLVRAGDEAIHMEIEGRHMRLTLPGAVLNMKLIDGTYPNYTRVIPKRSENIRVSLSGPALDMMCKAALRHGYRAAKIDIPAGIASISMGAGVGTIEIPVIGEGPSPTVEDKLRGSKTYGFNIKYLADIGRVAEVITIRAEAWGEPVIITSEDPDAFWVLMPMMI